MKNTKSLVLCGIMAAVMCVMSPWSINVGPVPLSLATLALYIIASLCRPKMSVAAMAVYISLGAVGLPVFSNFTGGLERIAGVTGGYIIGYLPCALIISLILNKHGKKWLYPVAMIAGTAVLYLFGTAWFCYATKTGFVRALSICVLPFLVGDGIKIAAASVLGCLLRPRLAAVSKAA